MLCVWFGCWNDVKRHLYAFNSSVSACLWGFSNSIWLCTMAECAFISMLCKWCCLCRKHYELIVYKRKKQKCMNNEHDIECICNYTKEQILCVAMITCTISVWCTQNKNKINELRVEQKYGSSNKVFANVYKFGGVHAVCLCVMEI